MTARSGNSRLTLWIVTAIAVILIAIGGAFVWKQATQSLIRSYILDHPEILPEAMEILQKRETMKRLAAAGGSLNKPFPGAIAGNPAGDVTVIEFTDYSCGYCRKSVADVQKLIANDTGVRVVYRELPILSPMSRVAAGWALAAAKQGKHKAFHDAMFAKGPPSENTIRAAAEAAGLDLARAQSDANSAEIAAEIDGNLAMMQQIGFNGTPTFVIGGKMIEGSMGYDMLKDAVEKTRKAKV
jgi:protein-disulfide isomerase